VLFRVLGPLELDLGDGVVIAPQGVRTRALLAALLLRPGSVVPVHRLADVVWGERSTHPENSVHVAVGRLRRALGPAGCRVITRAPGYLLDMDGARLDADLFEANCRAARDQVIRNPSAAVTLFDQALALWRGPAFGQFAESFAAPAAARLERLHIAAAEQRAEALLGSNAPDDAAAAASDLIARDPLAARPVAVLMRALAEQGQIAAALEAYSRHTGRMRAELGLDPTLELQELHTRLLRAEREPRPATPYRGLPHRPCPLIGRDAELAALGAAVQAGALVTIVGPGGVGKTRLALELAHHWASEQRAVWWVDLVPVHPGGVLDAVAAAAGIELPPGSDPARALTIALAAVRGVLVLDNAEHVLDPLAGWLERLCEAAPGLAVLVTTRERLALDHEQLQALPPLPLPVGADPTNPAVRLFLQRASQLGPLDKADLAAVSELCRHLDGLPLAIELGAARAATLGLDALNKRLSARLDLLGGARRTADRRHRTLRAVVSWSHDLLTADEAVVFRRLGVFPSSFSLDQAEAVCTRPAPAGTDVAGLLARLVEQSLVQRADGRFQLLETLRAFALEQLHTANEHNALRAAHARDTADRLTAASPRLWTADEPAAVRELTELTPDLHAAWRYAAEHQRSLALRLTGDIYYFAFYRQRLALLAWGLSVHGWPDEPELAGALGTAACALWAAGRVEEAVAAAERGIAIAGGRDAPAASIATQESATIAMILGQTDLAVTRYQDLAAVRRARDEPVLALLVELGAAHALVTADRCTEAAEIIEAVLPAAETSGNPTIQTWAHYLAGQASAATAPGRAADEYRTAIAAGEPADSRLFVTMARGSSAALAARNDRFLEALEALPGVLDEWLRLGNTGLLGWTLQQIVVLLADLGQDRDAALLAGALRADRVPTPAFTADTERVSDALERLNDRLGPQQTAATLEEGANLTPAAVLAHARNALSAATSSASTARSMPGWS
jgi:predicted ATPase/DNA-binding SARP family transcriptional activator